MAYIQKKYAARYDNGSGYMERIATPRLTRDEAVADWAQVIDKSAPVDILQLWCVVDGARCTEFHSYEVAQDWLDANYAPVDFGQGLAEFHEENGGLL